MTIMDREPQDAGGISARSYRALMRHQAGAVAIGELALGELDKGQWRRLSAPEVAALRTGQQAAGR